MKKFFATIIVVLFIGGAAQAQVLINETLFDPFGADSSASTGNEYFELRGTPGLSLAGYYLLSIEGDATANLGDVNQFFNLGAFSIGANGFLVGFQKFTAYSPVTVGATAFTNAGTVTGWGTNTGAGTIGYLGDGSQVDIEQPAMTLMLVNIGGGAAPTTTTDLDADNNGVLDALPAGWTLLDSISVLDGNNAGDFGYGALTFRSGTFLGTNLMGNVIDIGFIPRYVGRVGDSTGSTIADWFTSEMTNAPPNTGFSVASDSRAVGKNISAMQFGGTNNVPEPSVFGVLGFGLAALWLVRRRR